MATTASTIAYSFQLASTLLPQETCLILPHTAMYAIYITLLLSCSDHILKLGVKCYLYFVPIESMRAWILAKEALLTMIYNSQLISGAATSVILKAIPCSIQ